MTQPGQHIRQAFIKRQKRFKMAWNASSTIKKTQMVTAQLAVASTLIAAADTGAGVYVTTQKMWKVGWDKYVGSERKLQPFLERCASKQPCVSTFLGLKAGANGQRGGMLGNSHPWLWLISITALFASSVARQMGGIKIKEALPGYARFSNLSDPPLQKYMKPFPDSKGNDMRRGYLGLLEDGTILKAPMFLRCSHACIMGGPGARKSTGYHKPNMVMDALEGSTSIVIDLKYPDPKGGFFDMAPAFHKLKRSIQVFTPFDRNTMRLNLLESAIDIDSALELSSMIIPNDPNAGGGAFYRNIERTVLGALLLAIALSERPSMREVYRKIIAGPSALKDFILKHPDDTVKETAAAMLEIKVDQLTGIIASLQNQLAIFNSKALARATTPKAGQNLNLRQCFREPTLLYVGINQGDLRGNGQTLLQLVKRTIDQAMFDVSRENGGKLPIHTVFYLDEFANLGPLPNIQKDFATMRSYNVSYQVTLQNRAQGEDLYGLAGFKSFFENNLQFQIVFPAFLKMSDAELYSNNMGYTSFLERGTSESEAKNPFNRAGSGTRSKSEKISKRLLVTPDEMQDWAQEVAIIFMIGVRPTKAFMPRLDEPEIMIIDSRGVTRPLSNPLHRYWNELGLGGDPAEFMAELLQQRDAAMGNDDEDMDFNPIAAEERFQSWIMSLINYGAYVTPYRSQNRVVVFHRDLPGELINPADLPEFIEKGWVNIDNDRFRVTKKGAEALGITSVFAALCDLEYKGGLKLWIQRHASALAGHPAAQHVSSDDPLGYYEEEAITLTRESLDEIYRDLDPKRLEPYLVRKGGRSYYRIPISEDSALLDILNKTIDMDKPMGLNSEIAPKFSPGSEKEMEVRLAQTDPAKKDEGRERKENRNDRANDKPGDKGGDRSKNGGAPRPKEGEKNKPRPAPRKGLG